MTYTEYAHVYCTCFKVFQT